MHIFHHNVTNALWHRYWELNTQEAPTPNTFLNLELKKKKKRLSEKSTNN